MAMGEFYIGTIIDTVNPKEEIVGGTVQYTEAVLKISTTIICSMLEKVLMAFVEVDLGLGP